MKNKNLIRFVESFVLLPALTLSSVGSIPKDSSIAGPDIHSSIVSTLQQNIEGHRLFALNEAIDEDAKEEDAKQAQIAREAKAQAIDAYFGARKAPLAGKGMKMVEVAEENDLDWRLLPAIAMRESSGGLAACKKVKNSVFGFGSCKINFKSIEDSIEIVGSNLGGNNPKTARHYDGKTTEEILKAYNPPSIVPNYVPQVLKIMNDIGPIDLGKESKTEA
jgi:hypothetical protein